MHILHEVDRVLLISIIQLAHPTAVVLKTSLRIPCCGVEDWHGGKEVLIQSKLRYSKLDRIRRSESNILSAASVSSEITRFSRSTRFTCTLWPALTGKLLPPFCR